MTTSAHQRKMHRISPNNRVCRRLIMGDTVDDQASVDNFANVLQESIARDVKEKSKKWNFDFTKEEALRGRYDWFMKEGDEWVPMKPRDEEYSPRHENENTPHTVHDITGFLQPIRKRRNNIERNGVESVKRRMKFDEDNLIMMN